jgi:hypothetical protein
VHRLQQLGCALHHLVERVDVPGRKAPAGLRAGTNVYVKTAQGWRWSHHASPGSMADEPPRDGDAPSTLH